MNLAFIGRKLSLLFVLFYLWGCSSPPDIIKIGLSNRPYVAFFHLANEQHFFDKAKLSLHELPSPTETMQAFQVGKIDLAFLSIDQVVTLAEQSVDFKIISIIDKSEGSLALVSAKSISTVEQLKGKTIGLERLSSASILFTELRVQYPAIFKSVKTVEIRQNTALEILKGKDIDAIIVNAPIKQQLITSGAHELYNSAKMKQPILHFIVVRTEIVERNHEGLSNLLRGFYKAKQFFNLNKKSTYTAVRKQLDVTRQELENSLNEFEFMTQQEALVRMSGAPANIELQLIDLSEYMFKQKMLTESHLVDFSKLIDISFLRGIVND